MPSCFISQRDQLLVAFCYLSLSTIIALVVSDLGVVLGFVGASCGMVLTFIVPCACYVSLATGWSFLRIAALLTLILSIVLLPMCVAMQFM